MGPNNTKSYDCFHNPLWDEQMSILSMSDFSCSEIGVCKISAVFPISCYTRDCSNDIILSTVRYSCGFTRAENTNDRAVSAIHKTYLIRKAFRSTSIIIYRVRVKPST